MTHSVTPICRQPSPCELSAQHRIFDLLAASFRNDYESAAHLLRVSRCSQQLALAAGLPVVEVATIGAAALLHDVGKVAIPFSITRKRGPLTAAEQAIVQTHTTIGAGILQDEEDRVFRLARTIALTHHERWDGSGYPAGLRGDEIPLAGHIVAIANQYEALRSKRSYKPSLLHEQVCEILLRGDERTRPEHFDPILLEIFRRTSDTFSAAYATVSDVPTLDFRVTDSSGVAVPARVRGTPVQQL